MKRQSRDSQETANAVVRQLRDNQETNEENNMKNVLINVKVNSRREDDIGIYHYRHLES